MKKIFLSLLVIAGASVISVNAQSSIAVSSTDKAAATEEVAVKKSCHGEETTAKKACCSKDKAEAKGKTSCSGDKTAGTTGKACCSKDKAEAAATETKTEPASGTRNSKKMK